MSFHNRPVWSIRWSNPSFLFLASHLYRHFHPFYKISSSSKYSNLINVKKQKKMFFLSKRAVIVYWKTNLHHLELKCSAFSTVYLSLAIVSSYVVSAEIFKNKHLSQFLHAGSGKSKEKENEVFLIIELLWRLGLSDFLVPLFYILLRP